MKKILVITGIVILISSCTTFNSPSRANTGGNEIESQPVITVKEQSNSGHWVSLPSSSGITIIGVSNPMVKQADEITSAKEDAARKVAMYHGVEGEVETTSAFDGRAYFGSVSEFSLKLTYDQNYKKYIEQLTFDPQNDVVKVDGMVYVRFQYATTAASINYTTTKSNSRPQWINGNVPHIDGYMTKMGVAQNQVRIKDTINKSIESAISMMVQEISTSVNSYDYVSSGGQSLTATSTASRGKLNGFNVIEFWIDPKTKYVYTLAIAKESK